ncbi:hypothetical protein M3M39_02570 [Fructilactobacillus hinvesii]|uniref:ABC transmembrane type-1 domain-containing protein n=1 Tax=Fructilactobacillus hinvesii TaxID=2940300 RepID=A0ABY5BTV4_9LACO|nr:hypothetical protein [Fructilactobacillus hinvesii]USS88380.1 hypothetical protein M3M39_02570 [Fructilactobacillus hinvesii]
MRLEAIVPVLIIWLGVICSIIGIGLARQVAKVNAKRTMLEIVQNFSLNSTFTFLTLGIVLLIYIYFPWSKSFNTEVYFLLIVLTIAIPAYITFKYSKEEYESICKNYLEKYDEVKVANFKNSDHFRFTFFKSLFANLAPLTGTITVDVVFLNIINSIFLANNFKLDFYLEIDLLLIFFVAVCLNSIILLAASLNFLNSINTLFYDNEMLLQAEKPKEGRSNYLERIGAIPKKDPRHPR